MKLRCLDHWTTGARLGSVNPSRMRWTQMEMLSVFRVQYQGQDRWRKKDFERAGHYQIAVRVGPPLGPSIEGKRLAGDVRREPIAHPALEMRVSKQRGLCEVD